MPNAQIIILADRCRARPARVANVREIGVEAPSREVTVLVITIAASVATAWCVTFFPLLWLCS